MTYYLGAQSLIAINESQVGPGCVGDMHGVESAAFRPQSGFGDADLFPDIWAKAGALLHSIASNQYFTDGNKRTAWLAANIFLDKNGYELPHINDIGAEIFVQSIGQDIFKTEDEPNASIGKAGEFLHTAWARQRAGASKHHRLEYVFLAEAVQPFGNGTFNVMRGGIFSFTVEDHPGLFPLPFEFAVIGRFHWNSGDNIVPHTLTATLVPEPGGKRINTPSATLELRQFSPPPSGHPQHAQSGLLPLLFHIQLTPIFLAFGPATVELSLDGEVIAELPFQLLKQEGAPNLASLAATL
ncbi:Fic family protein [Mycobacterium sp. ITM-2016-00316]|uniref:type II toxin-antitoxin system death-on-curing family toxin n=1 Tax=Mycobacterium sp. ITM-2016-00316 TaxID=2099695 RepID=UPI0018ED4B89|nr:Fic family protein [Mycobacterium sp. ITM-2016-00316]WNG80174.1 Fic family protein [Mycobacterium sp. ITM-2016-00316]